MKALLLVLLVVSGCTYWDCRPGDFCVDGTLVQGLPSELQTDDVRTRLAHEKEIALAYWGHDRAAMAGWRVVYVAPADGLAGFPCGSSITGRCQGDTNPWNHTITLGLDIGSFKDCPEWAPLPHEIGHAVKYDTLLNLDGDHGHTDARWRTFGLIAHEVIQDNVPACAGAVYFIEHNEFWNIHAGTS